MPDQDLVQAPRYATLNLTYAGQNGDLPDPLLFDTTDDQIRQIATEAVRGGGVRGIDPVADANFADFVVDRISAHDGLPDRLILRPKTPFGLTRTFCDGCGTETTNTQRTYGASSTTPKIVPLDDGSPYETDEYLGYELCGTCSKAMNAAMVQQIALCRAMAEK